MSAITVESVTLREIRLPLCEPFQISSGTVEQRRVILLELRDAGGKAAWAECVAGEHPNYSPETVDTAWLALHLWLVPAVLSRTFPHPSDVHAALDAVACGHRMAKAALEMGAWGLAAEVSGVPLAELLGGTRSSLEVGISLGIHDSPHELARRVAAEVEAGYRRIKLKIKPGSDVDFIRAARSEIVDGVALTVDANAAYGPDDLRHLAGFDEFELAMIEQPLDREDLVRHGHLQARLRTPICLDESIDSPDRAEDMIALRSGRIINIKAGRVGGLESARAIHDRCREACVPVWCGGMLETGVGRAYNVALASLPNFTLPGDLSPSRRYWHRDIVVPEWTMDENGTVRVPLDRPGIGVDVDRDRVDALTVRVARFGQETPV